MMGCVVSNQTAYGTASAQNPNEKFASQATESKQATLSIQRMAKINFIIKMTLWLLVMVPVLNGAKINQWPLKVCRYVGQSVTLSCEIHPDYEEGMWCLPHWSSVKGSALEVQFKDRYCVKRGMDLYTYFRINNLQASDNNTTLLCSMDCKVDTTFKTFSGVHSIIEVKQTSEELCPSTEEVIQWSSGTQQYTGDFVVFGCMLNFRKENVRECHFSWYIGDFHAFHTPLISSRNLYGHRLLFDKTEMASQMILGDLQLNDSNTYYCKVNCTTDCEPWAASGNGSTLVVTHAPVSEDEASGKDFLHKHTVSLPSMSGSRFEKESVFLFSFYRA
ncbi:uncharacterized protein LOC108930299 [Scleropages formosus]|uniref:uncharacterized protein LOC108930299 n=1 Tax=Scleropages formosus TaxID=113540 RepID=UPI00087914D0|nr:uncharacterized protein LOC108930299 [Scleropages formosus]